mmetsp:Transcript_39779/g.93136  ORF Transcript_39779/g.93136 Transcript_39779/m.93136 type:complete len:204 (+) Transcript_39779:295-906(+)
MSMRSSFRMSAQEVAPWLRDSGKLGFSISMPRGVSNECSKFSASVRRTDSTKPRFTCCRTSKPMTTLLACPASAAVHFKGRGPTCSSLCSCWPFTTVVASCTRPLGPNTSSENKFVFGAAGGSCAPTPNAYVPGTSPEDNRNTRDPASAVQPSTGSEISWSCGPEQLRTNSGGFSNWRIPPGGSSSRSRNLTTNCDLVSGEAG